MKKSSAMVYGLYEPGNLGPRKETRDLVSAQTNAAVWSKNIPVFVVKKVQVKLQAQG